MCMRVQVLTTQQLEQMKQEWMEKVKQHLRKVCTPCMSQVHMYMYNIHIHVHVHVGIGCFAIMYMYIHVQVRVYVCYCIYFSFNIKLYGNIGIMCAMHV